MRESRGAQEPRQRFQAVLSQSRTEKQGKWKGKRGYPKVTSKKKAIGGARFIGSIHVYPDAIQLPRLGIKT